MTTNNLPRIVALCGAAGSGKTTAADYLVEHFGYTRIKFADPLKNMLRAAGLTESQIEGGDKEKPAQSLCGKSPRQLMQTLGTEWGREQVGVDFWVNLWVERVDAVLKKGGKIIVDDMRFQNEFASVRELSGAAVMIHRPSVLNKAGFHASETSLIAPEIPVVINDNDVSAMCHAVVKQIIRAA